MKRLKLLSNKGQVSFELIIVLAVVLMFITAVMVDFFEETSDSFVLASVKVSAAKELAMSDDPTCIFSRVSSIEFSDETITLTIDGCPPDSTKIADEAEKACGFSETDHDSIIRCGTKNYILDLVIT